VTLLDFIALGPKLRELINHGLAAWDRAPYRQGVSDAIYEASLGWNPDVRGIPILEDDATRRAGADFMAGIVCSLRRHGFRP